MIAVNAKLARSLLREIAKFERVMSMIEAHPDVVSEETDHRLARLAQRLREFTAARAPRE